MNNIILYNPRCTKSRQTLKLTEDNNLALEVIEYLKTPPTVEQLDDICNKLGVEPTEIIRTKEKLFTELRLSLSDKKSRIEWLKILSEKPKLIERPIVIYKGKAVIGRPPEKVLEII
ncbi:MAG: arsenate reductase (glutaredoxin) [Candidatus Dadabacteria bacterium]|nr:arsenate reductase (glutaredoxin) [Candidatus Dadabacteria bacterium]NIS09198.1 arsenate reductase (glutaredoxin) [Candidatus Dadabacteria bacterium]NIV41814.1 arsenate reductase (glutaredoxin) [Candidatus Dadabacteria bacterium]NIX15757.1 arsenate reductase (glutaredoxin) [Candidatus Dadabacteria bacterium]NIY22629.1 arsenate reductase (glutaredoxin) [Candidatus Dadabacteria bacterium]